MSKPENLVVGEPLLAGPARRRGRRFVLGGGMIVAVIGWWAWYSQGDPQRIFVVSSPLDTVRTLYQMAVDPTFWTVQVRATAEGFLIGWLLAIASGLLLGVLMGWHRGLREMLEPFIFAFNAIPRIALIPVIMVWAGYGLTYKVVVVALASFFPIVMNTSEGIANADPRLVQMSSTFGATDSQILRAVAVPDSVPLVFAGLRQSLTHAITGIVGAEIWASAAGIGWIISDAAVKIQTGRIIAAVVVVTVTGVSLNEVLQRAEAHFTRWRQIPS